MTTLAEIISAFIPDEAPTALPAGFPPSRSAAWKHLNRRGDEARAILLDELRRARVDYTGCVAEQHAAAICFRYIRAAHEGASRLTLRLLCQLIAAQMKAAELSSVNFLASADAIASLTPDEIAVLGALYQRAGRGDDDGAGLHRGLAAWLATKRDLMARGWSEQYLFARCGAIQRIGLLVATPMVGGVGFRPSPLMIEFGKALDFEDALRREPVS